MQVILPMYDSYGKAKVARKKIDAGGIPNGFNIRNSMILSMFYTVGFYDRTLRKYV